MHVIISFVKQTERIICSAVHVLRDSRVRVATKTVTPKDPQSRLVGIVEADKVAYCTTDIRFSLQNYAFYDYMWYNIRKERFS